MAKLPNYNGTIDLISGLRPKNNGTFPLMQAHDVQATETQRLDEMFKNPESWLPVYNGENEGGTAGGGGSGGNYVLELTGESGTLTDEQYQAVVDNFPNVVVKVDTTIIAKPSVDLAQNYIFISQYSPEIATPTNIKSILVLITNNKTYQIAKNISVGGITKQQITITELQNMTNEALSALENGDTSKLIELLGTPFFIAFQEYDFGTTAFEYLPFGNFCSYGGNAGFVIRSIDIASYNNKIDIRQILIIIGTIKAIELVTTEYNQNTGFTSTTEDKTQYLTDENCIIYIYK